MTAAVPSTRRARGFEPWMISNVAVGMAVGSFLTLLVPPFITDVTGSAARVGIVFALVSLAATVGPWFGGRADRSGRHRRYYLIAMIAVSGSFALLAPCLGRVPLVPAVRRRPRRLLRGAGYDRAGLHRRLRPFPR